MPVQYNCPVNHHIGNDDLFTETCLATENNRISNLFGPTEVTYHKNGLKYIESWYILGRFHREDGPAVRFSRSGRRSTYYLHDVV